MAPEAYERSTGLLWDHETAVGYETGANAAADARAAFRVTEGPD